VVVYAAFALSNPSFGQWSNFVGIWQNASIAGILFIGLTWVIASGEMDVAFAQIAALSSVVFAFLLTSRWGPASAALIAIGSGVAFGVLNGLLVGLLRLPALIVTIATGGVASACAFILGAGQPIYVEDSGFVGEFVDSSLAGLPSLGLLCIVFYAVAWVVQDRFLFGHHVYALAQNRKALELAISPATTIHVLSATYGQNVGAAPGNATTSAEVCDGLVTCFHEVHDGEYFPDPAPGAVENYVATWTCGSDPTLHTLSLPAGAGVSGVPAVFDCP
jgi:ribose/xylose/arabinose/galactoside ABC-type transport system permease subunit